VSASWSMVLESVLPSSNVFMRMHWAKRKKMIQLWAWMLREAGIRDIPPAGGRTRAVTIIRYAPRMLDEPNLYLAADKCILDNLVKEGVLVDDSPQWLVLKVGQTRSKGKRTLVQVEEIVNVR